MRKAVKVLNGRDLVLAEVEGMKRVPQGGEILHGADLVVAQLQRLQPGQGLHPLDLRDLVAREIQLCEILQRGQILNLLDAVEGEVEFPTNTESLRVKGE